MKSETLCRIFAGLWGGLLVMALALAGSGAIAFGGPLAIVPETSFDFGAVHEGEDVRHPFVIENKGDAPLVLLDVKTD